MCKVPSMSRMPFIILTFFLNPSKYPVPPFPTL